MGTLWKIVNIEKGNKNEDTSPIIIIDNNKTVSDQKMVAELFNNYFLIKPNSITHNKNFDKNVSNFDLYSCSNKHKTKSIPNIAWQHASTSEIKKIIHSLKPSNSSGYDDITNRILKYSSPYILSPLTHIFHTVLRTGVS